eukprot:TRINITY_DN4979_c0_g1_i9.p1 TRINITY_DN4979_c0_g1~~TRINITY_DN4979_c0_g1_i9.p1  ORF type:complete len:1559 (-),score=222.41 TRINITY_DN4979_c0_g1_i9:1525-5559(-)
MAQETQFEKTNNFLQRKGHAPGLTSRQENRPRLGRVANFVPNDYSDMMSTTQEDQGNAMDDGMNISDTQSTITMNTNSSSMLMSVTSLPIQQSNQPIMAYPIISNPPQGTQNALKWIKKDQEWPKKVEKTQPSDKPTGNTTGTQFSEDGMTLYVSNIPRALRSHEKVLDHFQKISSVDRIEANENHAIIKFSTPEDAALAKSRGKFMGQQKIKMTWYHNTPRDPRTLEGQDDDHATQNPEYQPYTSVSEFTQPPSLGLTVKGAGKAQLGEALLNQRHKESILPAPKAIPQIKRVGTAIADTLPARNADKKAEIHSIQKYVPPRARVTHNRNEYDEDQFKEDQDDIDDSQQDPNYVDLEDQLQNPEDDFYENDEHFPVIPDSELSDLKPLKTDRLAGIGLSKPKKVITKAPRVNESSLQLTSTLSKSLIPQTKGKGPILGLGPNPVSQAIPESSTIKVEMDHQTMNPSSKLFIDSQETPLPLKKLAGPDKPKQKTSKLDIKAEPSAATLEQGISVLPSKGKSGADSWANDSSQTQQKRSQTRHIMPSFEFNGADEDSFFNVPLEWIDYNHQIPGHEIRKGICELMCPDRSQTVTDSLNLDSYEKPILKYRGKLRNVSDVHPVKAFERSTQERHLSSTNIRSISCLKRVIDYLVKLIIEYEEDGDVGLFKFVSDRLRAVIIDLTWSNNPLTYEHIQVFETAVKFAIHLDYQMCKLEPQFRHHRDREEMLPKMLAGLKQYYDRDTTRVILFPNETEFQCYYNIQFNRIGEAFRRRRDSPLSELTYQVLFCNHSKNVPRFFRNLENAPYFLSALAYRYVENLREWPIIYSRHFGRNGLNPQQVEAFLYLDNDLPIPTSSDSTHKKQWLPSYKYVESKRSGIDFRTLIYSQIQENDAIYENPEEPDSFYHNSQEVDETEELNEDRISQHSQKELSLSRGGKISSRTSSEKSLGQVVPTNSLQSLVQPTTQPPLAFGSNKTLFGDILTSPPELSVKSDPQTIGLRISTNQIISPSNRRSLSQTILSSPTTSFHETNQPKESLRNDVSLDQPKLDMILSGATTSLPEPTNDFNQQLIRPTPLEKDVQCEVDLDDNDADNLDGQFEEIYPAQRRFIEYKNLQDVDFVGLRENYLTIVQYTDLDLQSYSEKDSKNLEQVRFDQLHSPYDIEKDLHNIPQIHMHLPFHYGKVLFIIPPEWDLSQHYCFLTFFSGFLSNLPFKKEEGTDASVYTFSAYTEFDDTNGSTSLSETFFQVVLASKVDNLDTFRGISTVVFVYYDFDNAEALNKRSQELMQLSGKEFTSFVALRIQNEINADVEPWDMLHVNYFFEVHEMLQISCDMAWVSITCFHQCN